VLLFLISVLFSSYLSLINTLHMSLSQCLRYSFLTKPTAPSTCLFVLADTICFLLCLSPITDIAELLNRAVFLFSNCSRFKNKENYFDAQPQSYESIKRVQSDSVRGLHQVLPFLSLNNSVQ